MADQRVGGEIAQGKDVAGGELERIGRASHVVLAIRAGDRSRLVADFRKFAQAPLTGPDPAEPLSAPPTRSGA